MTKLFEKIDTEEDLLRRAYDVLYNDAYELEELFLEYSLFSTSANAPYHNKIHTSAMIVLLDRMDHFADAELFVAIALHDFNHSAGKLPDSENIKEALRKSKSAVYGWNGNVERLITATQYPYVTEAIQEDEKLIRDLDLSMPLLPLSISVKLFEGLAQEMGVDDMKKFSDGVREFYSKVEMKSELGKKFLQPNLMQCVDQLCEELVKMDSIFNRKHKE